MDLSTVVSDLKAHFETAKTDAEKFLADHLPELGALVSKAETNPALNAIVNAEHLSEVPEFLATIADWITKADQALAAAKAAGAAEAAQPPAEPAPAEPAA